MGVERMSLKTRALTLKEKKDKKKVLAKMNGKAGEQPKKLSKIAEIRRKTRAIRAKNATLAGAKSAHKKKVRTKVAFRRPHTLRLARKPRYETYSSQKLLKNDIHSIIDAPVTSESAMRKIEDNN